MLLIDRQLRIGIIQTPLVHGESVIIDFIDVKFLMVW